jgi:hypothetical protein
MEENNPHPPFSADWIAAQIERCKPTLFKELIAFKRYKNSKIIIKEDGVIKALTPDEFALRVSTYLATTGEDETPDDKADENQT